MSLFLYSPFYLWENWNDQFRTRSNKLTYHPAAWHTFTKIGKWGHGALCDLSNNRIDVYCNFICVGNSESHGYFIIRGLVNNIEWNRVFVKNFMQELIHFDLQSAFFVWWAHSSKRLWSYNIILGCYCVVQSLFCQKTNMGTQSAMCILSLWLIYIIIIDIDNELKSKI